MSWYLCLKFYFFFKYQCKKIIVIHNNLVAQKISYFKIVYQPHKTFLYIWRRMCVNFLRYLINFFVQMSSSSMLVENDCNLLIAKMFLTVSYIYNYHWKKSLETYVSICCVTCIYFYFILTLFDSGR